jgi:hypothetical protein
MADAYRLSQVAGRVSAPVYLMPVVSDTRLVGCLFTCSLRQEAGRACIPGVCPVRHEAGRVLMQKKLFINNSVLEDKVHKDLRSELLSRGGGGEQEKTRTRDKAWPELFGEQDLLAL